MKNYDIFGISAVCLLSADCLLFAILAEMDSLIHHNLSSRVYRAIALLLMDRHRRYMYVDVDQLKLIVRNFAQING